MSTDRKGDKKGDKPTDKEREKKRGKNRKIEMGQKVDGAEGLKK